MWTSHCVAVGNDNSSCKPGASNPHRNPPVLYGLYLDSTSNGSLSFRFAFNMSPLLIIRLSLAEKIGLPYRREKSFRSQKARWANFLQGELVYATGREVSASLIVFF